MAAAQIEAPTMPTEAQRIRPLRGPTFFMYCDACMVASAPPTTQQVTGSVASAGFGASASPARPLIAINVALLVISIAWQAASSPTLKPALRANIDKGVRDMYTVSGRECNS